MPLDKEFYYRDFKQAVAIKLNDLIKQLHLAYQKRNDNIIEIKDNIAKYNAVHLDVSQVFEIDPSERINTNKSGYNKLPIKYRSYIASYNYLVYEKIPNLQRNIQTYAAVHNCTREFYSPFIQYITRDISKQLLKGNSYSFGEKIGYIKVFIQYFANPLKGLHDRLASLKVRQNLIKNGLIPKGRENPDGARWKVYSLGDWWMRARYRTTNKSVVNSKSYKFKWGWTCELGRGNTPSYHQDDEFDEIIENKTMNFLNKLLTICFNFPLLKWDLYENNKPKDSKNNYDEQSIICE